MVPVPKSDLFSGGFAVPKRDVPAPEPNNPVPCICGWVLVAWGVCPKPGRVVPWPGPLRLAR